MEKKRILVIDDEKDLTELIKLNLEQTGKYEVKTENDGALGPEVAKAFKPDLILLDILMPDADGCEIGYQLENDEDTKNIPIVFLTAVVNEKEVRKSGGVMGGHPFIAKPVDTEKLIEVIEKNIR